MMETNLEDRSNYRLNEISKIKNYFNEEIQYQQSLTNRLNKCLTILDYFNKMLTIVLTVFSSTNIFAHVKGKEKLLGLITSIFSLLFSLSFGITIKLHQETKLRKKKHSRLLYSAKNKLDCIEMLISNSIKGGIINHDEFLEILKEKKEYNCLKNEGCLIHVKVFNTINFFIKNYYKHECKALLKNVLYSL